MQDLQSSFHLLKISPQISVMYFAKFYVKNGHFGSYVSTFRTLCGDYFYNDQYSLTEKIEQKTITPLLGGELTVVTMQLVGRRRTVIMC